MVTISQDAEEPATAAGGVLPQPVRRTGVRQRILVVDDEPSVRHLIKQVLVQEHYEVEAAGTALEALEQLQTAPFDLAIVDLLLPGINGLDLAEAIRMLDPGTPVILMTAYGTPTLENLASHPAIRHYLHKPFALERLLALVDSNVNK